MIARSSSSRCARVERFVGSVCCALCRKYVDGAIGSSVQIDSTPWIPRWASMTPPSLRSAVELRLGKIRRRFPEDVICAFQLAHLALQLLQSLPLVGRQAAALARIAFGLAHPPPQCLRRASELAGD